MEENQAIKDVVNQLDRDLLRILVEMNDGKMYYPNLCRKVETIAHKLKPIERSHLETRLRELMKIGFVAMKPRPTPNYIYGLTLGGAIAAKFAKAQLDSEKIEEELGCRRFVWDHFDPRNKMLKLNVLDRTVSKEIDYLPGGSTLKFYKVRIRSSFHCYECNEDHEFEFLAATNYLNEYHIVYCRNAEFGWKVHQSLMKKPFKRWSEWT